jgi:tRNA-Thr(GGU) m(6)t(6)A37 methyltransferase TsaA
MNKPVLMKMSPLKEIELKPIGYVRRLSKREDVKDRSLISHIIVRKELAKALEGVEGFSHLLVIFYMHEIPKEETKALKVHPRGRTDLPLLGVFSTRTAYRPNPIGLTLVELLKRKGNVLVVRGLDAFDGTPVLDLKPFDSKDMTLNAKVPEWHKKLHS